MWKHMARIIGEVRPKYCFVENSPMLTSKGLGTVLGDLAKMGFDAEWGVLSAADVGANHQRERIWIVAHTNSKGFQWTHNNQKKTKRVQQSFAKCIQTGVPITRTMLSTSYFQRRSDAMACWMDRLKAIGNGQVPLCAATAWELLKARLDGQ
jgi:DNA (cytosine-5)-methyltransferase 1